MSPPLAGPPGSEPADGYDPVTETHVVEVTWYDDDRLP